MIDDPDAPSGTWDHLILKNIPASVTSLDEGLKNLPSQSKFLKNSFGDSNYGGPCPPSGKHHYHFKLYALDVEQIDGENKQDLEQSMKAHILQRAELVGLYEK